MFIVIWYPFGKPTFETSRWNHHGEAFEFYPSNIFYLLWNRAMVLSNGLFPGPGCAICSKEMRASRQKLEGGCPVTGKGTAWQVFCEMHRKMCKCFFFHFFILFLGGGGVVACRIEISFPNIHSFDGQTPLRHWPPNGYCRPFLQNLLAKSGP